MQIFLVLEEQLTFVKFVYMVGGYIATLSGVDLEKCLIEGSGQFSETPPRVFDTDNFGVFAEKTQFCAGCGRWRRKLWTICCEGAVTI